MELLDSVFEDGEEGIFITANAIQNERFLPLIRWMASLNGEGGERVTVHMHVLVTMAKEILYHYQKKN